MTFDPLSWKDYVTEGAALLGAALGIMNTWNSVNQKKVRLRVRPAMVISSSGPRMFCIEVINLSAFPLTISEIGFTLGGNRLGKGPRGAMSPPILNDGGGWPRKLQPREAVTGFCYLGAVRWDLVGTAYAKTACEEIAYGTSPALKGMVRHGSDDAQG